MCRDGGPGHALVWGCVQNQAEPRQSIQRQCYTDECMQSQVSAVCPQQLAERQILYMCLCFTGEFAYESSLLAAQPMELLRLGQEQEEVSKSADHDC